MIRQYTVLLAADAPIRYRPQLAYPLYAELMRRVDPAFAGAVHGQGITPISQYLLPAGEGAFCWRVSAFGEEAAGQVGAALGGLSSLRLDQEAVSLEVKRVELSGGIGTAQLRERAERQAGSLRTELICRTPVSFRSQGEYQFFPTAPLVVKSLVQRFNACAGDAAVQDEDAVQALIGGLKLTRYHLESVVYAVKAGAEIPAFRGSFTLSARLSPPLQELWQILAEFSAFSGLGIKTALGMGAVEARHL